MKVTSILESRMGNTRLPGKTMARILKRPMLELIIERLRFSERIDEIVITITKGVEDDCVEKLAQRIGLFCFRGSSMDVLDRDYIAARRCKTEVIVRMCSDRAMVDPRIIDKVVDFYFDKKIDYASNCLIPSYPHGLEVEVFSFETLRTAWILAKEPYQKEHVTRYIYEHPEIFRVGGISNNSDLSWMRWVVDEKEDLRFVREVYKRLYRKGKIFLMDDILALLKGEPELLKINSKVEMSRINYWSKRSEE